VGPRRRPTRRDFIRRRITVALLLVVGLGVTVALVWPSSGGRHPSTVARNTSGTTASSASTSRPSAGRSVSGIAIENRRPGTTAWRIPAGTNTTAIQGYADRVSATRGETVTLFVDATGGYRVEGYRMGWYGGAGARRVWRSAPQVGARQSKPVILTTSRTVEARWRPSVRVAIDTAWVPGDYLLKLVADSGAQHYVPLTVRDDAAHHALLVVNAVTTWQAYNQWGGHSLYKGPLADPKLRSTIVSFDRPYERDGAGDFLGNEYPLVSLVEQRGLDVSYATSIDLHAHPELALDHRGIVSLGHDEYWTLAMRDAVAAARDRGVNLAFFGANAVYRRIRLEPSLLGRDRREVNYRVAKLDPLLGTNDAEVTTSWREAPAARPEGSLLGVMYECNPVLADGVVADASSWVFDGSGLRNGERVRGLIGSEYDRVMVEVPTPSTLQVLFHSPLTCRKHASFSDAAYYTAESGAGVFDAGTGNWVCKLLTGCPTDQPVRPDASIRRITENVLRAFAAGPAGVAHPSSPNVARLGILARTGPTTTAPD